MWHRRVAMKDIITSLVRHAVTALLSFGALAASHGWVAPEDAPAVAASSASLEDALVVIVVAVVSRLLMTYGGKFFKNTDLGNGGGMSSLLLCMGLGFVGFFLTSCTLFSPVSPVPVRACYYDKHGRVCYDNGGLSVELTSGK